MDEPRETRESKSRQFSCVCSFVSMWAFYDCKSYCYWRLMRVVISDCKPLSIFLLIWIYCRFEDQRLSMIYGSLSNRGSVVFSHQSLFIFKYLLIHWIERISIYWTFYLVFSFFISSTYQHLILFSVKKLLCLRWVGCLWLHCPLVYPTDLQFVALSLSLFIHLSDPPIQNQSYLLHSDGCWTYTLAVKV